jgi:hypothetical protein
VTTGERQCSTVTPGTAPEILVKYADPAEDRAAVPLKPGMVAPSAPRAIALLPGPRVIVIRPDVLLRMLSGVLPVNFS